MHRLGEELGDIVCHGTLARVFAEQFEQEVDDILGDGTVEGLGRNFLFLDVVEGFGKAAAAERIFAEEHFAGDDADAEYVGSGRDVLGVADLFGAHVRGCAELGEIFREFLVFFVVGDTEVQKPYAAVLVEHDVGGLHVAVRHAVAVRFGKARRNLEDEFHDDPEGRLGALVQEEAQALAVNEFHGERILPVRFLPEGVGVDDDGVVQLREDLGFALEPFDEGTLIVQRGDHLLHDDHAVERFVVAEVDVAHGAVAKELRRLVYANLLREGVLHLLFSLALTSYFLLSK